MMNLISKLRFKIMGVYRKHSGFTPLQFYRKMYNLFSTLPGITNTSGNKKLYKTVTGFTLMETLIAVMILSFAITGPMYIAQKGIQASIYSRDELTASYLAQEAIEYIRFVRDSNRIRIDHNVQSTGGVNLNWLSFITSDPDNGVDVRCTSNCTINTTVLDYFSSGSLAIIPYRFTSSVPYLAFQTDNAYYGYPNGIGTWKNTLFKRWVTVAETIPNVEATITVNIGWNPGFFSASGGFQRKFSIKEYIYNY